MTSWLPTLSQQTQSSQSESQKHVWKGGLGELHSKALAGKHFKTLRKNQKGNASWFISYCIHEERAPLSINFKSIISDDVQM